MKSKRLIQVDDIPKSMWDVSTQKLSLPPALTNTWLHLLASNNLLELAKLQDDSDGATGGVDKDSTDKHLAWRFNGSATRTLLALLDPKENLGEIPNAFAKIFSGGIVTFSDLPSGSAAASLTVLATLAELRRLGVVPREPLNLILICGEISPHAHAYANQAVSHIKPTLESQAIFVTLIQENWDVCNIYSNTNLVRKIVLSSAKSDTKILMISNFSGFLKSAGKWKDASPQLDELFRYSSHGHSTAIWIEPKTKGVLHALSGFFTDFIKWAMKKLHVKFFILDTTNTPVATTDCHSVNTITNEEFSSRLAVMRFDLSVE